MPTNTATDRFTPNPQHHLQPRTDAVREQEEDEEALSLSDLPLLTDQREESTTPSKPDEFNFDFGSLAASLEQLESEMCSADEVFYRGQILPFRHSVSAGSSSSSSTKMMSRCPSQPISRSGSGSGFRSESYNSSTSRSSSTNSSGSYSNNTLQTNINNNNTTDTTPRGDKITSDLFDDKKSTSSRFNNYFHSFPSPKPQLRTTGSSTTAPRASFSNNNNNATTPPSSAKKSSPLWEIFRLGLVRAPEIDLEGWKNRQASKFDRGNNNGVTAAAATVYSRNSSGNSCGSSGNSYDIDSGNQSIVHNNFSITGRRSYVRGMSSGNRGCYKYDRLRPSGENRNSSNSNVRRSEAENVKQRRKRRERRSLSSSDGGGSGSGLFNFVNYGSCRCAIGAIEPENSTRSRRKEDTNDEDDGKKKEKSLTKRVVVVSRHRTFEWLRDISSVGVLNTTTTAHTTTTT